MPKNILIGTVFFSHEWSKPFIDSPHDYIKIQDYNDIACDTDSVDYYVPMSYKDYKTLLGKNISIDKIIHPNYDTSQILHNKALFTKFMLDNFPAMIPRVYFLGEQLYDIAQLSDMEYPVISKPVYSTNGSNMTIYKNEEEFKSCTNRTIIQKFINDLYEYSAHLLCISGRIINYKIIRHKYPEYHIKTTTFPPEAENVPDFDMTNLESVVSKLNYTGGMCVNFKMRGDNILIFEMNPRFGGSAFTNLFICELLYIP